MNPTPLALFDLDGTLTDRDTMLPFLIGYARRCGRLSPLVRLPVELAVYAVGLRRDRDAKERLIRLFCGGHELDRIEEHAREFVRAWLPKRWRHGVVDMLHSHQREGRRVILISASNDLYVPLVAGAIGVSEVVCTRIARRDGRCVGDIVGTNCKGDEKVRRLREHLGGEIPPGSYAYGDSTSDIPLLRAVEHGFLIDRKGGLRPIARSR